MTFDCGGMSGAQGAVLVVAQLLCIYILGVKTIYWMSQQYSGCQDNTLGVKTIHWMSRQYTGCQAVNWKSRQYTAIHWMLRQYTWFQGNQYTECPGSALQNKRALRDQAGL